MFERPREFSEVLPPGEPLHCNLDGSLPERHDQGYSLINTAVGQRKLFYACSFLNRKYNVLPQLFF